MHRPPPGCKGSCRKTRAASGRGDRTAVLVNGSRPSLVPFHEEMLVGAAGFEPTTTSPPDWCATRLRHAPTNPESSTGSARCHANVSMPRERLDATRTSRCHADEPRLSGPTDASKAVELALLPDPSRFGDSRARNRVRGPGPRSFGPRVGTGGHHGRPTAPGAACLACGDWWSPRVRPPSLEPPSPSALRGEPSSGRSRRVRPWILGPADRPGSA